MPTTRPRTSMSGPPEKPGYNVRSTASTSPAGWRPPRTSRALMMPALARGPTPSARTRWPTRSSPSSATSAAGMLSTSARSTAMSRPGSRPATRAESVRPSGEVTLTAPYGRTRSARLAGRDPGLDIAVLRAEVESMPAADVADDGELRVGHLVLALGVGPRASAGIISALDVRGGRQPAGEVLAVDLTLYPGFSGGPLIDVRGRVVGITTSGVSRHLQCAIRAGAVGRLVEQVVRGGRIPRAYLGVGTQAVELPEPLRDRLSLAQRTAVIVLNIRSDGPAGAAGVVIGDLIVAIDGHAITEPEDLVAVLRPDRVGQVVAVSILRGGEPRELRVTVGERPQRA